MDPFIEEMRMLKKVALFCCGLLIVTFGQAMAIETSLSADPVLEAKDGLMPQVVADEMTNLESQILTVKTEIEAYESRGLDAPASLWETYRSLMARSNELERIQHPETDRNPSENLDQGGSTPSQATVVTLVDGSFCDTGTMSEED